MLNSAARRERDTHTEKEFAVLVNYRELPRARTEDKILCCVPMRIGSALTEVRPMGRSIQLHIHMCYYCNYCYSNTDHSRSMIHLTGLMQRLLLSFLVILSRQEEEEVIIIKKICFYAL